MKKTKRKSRTEMTHTDWITVYGIGSEKRGAELLKILRDKIGVSQNEKTYAGFGGGWFFEQFIDRGFRLSTNDEASAKVELQGLYWTGAVANPFDKLSGALPSITTNTKRRPEAAKCYSRASPSKNNGGA